MRRMIAPLAAAATLFCLMAPVLVMTGCSGDGSGPADAVVSAAWPDSGNVGTMVEITGNHFETGVEVWFDDLPCEVVEVVSRTLVRAYAPDSLVVGAVYDIKVANRGGEAAELTDAYRAVEPELLVVNGVSRPSGNQGSPAIFDGHSFGDLLGKGTVYFTDGSGLPVPAEVVLDENWTNEFIVAVVPPGAETGPVWIDTPNGATTSVIFIVTQSATFSPSAINWTGTQALPDSLQGTGALFVTSENGGTPVNRLYVTGGADGSVQPTKNVWQTEVGGAGAWLPWAAGPELPEEMAFHGSAVVTPFNALIDTLVEAHFYVIGGIDSAGAPLSAVYRATLDGDGSLGGWAAMNPLPVPLHSMGVAIFRSWIFVAGGATDGNQPVSTVYRAHIEFDGTLGPWESQASLPAPRAYAPLIQFAGRLYLVGGESSAVPPGSGANTATSSSAVFYHGLDLRTVQMGTASWTSNSATLIKSVHKHTAIIAGATLLVSGGLYNGAGSSATEHQYAEMNPDYSVGSFHGATGSQTIGGSSGAGGVPFFNHAAVAYTDNLGQAHVIIIGGAAVNSPTTAISETYYY